MYKVSPTYRTKTIERIETVFFWLNILTNPTQNHFTCTIQSSLEQTPDNKKEEYKRYLERTGVTDALTKVMVSLYEEPEKPQNAIEYIKKYLGTQNGDTEYDRIKKENEELHSTIKDLETQIGDLRKMVGTDEV